LRLRYARALTPDKRRPGQVPGRTPGLLHARAAQGRVRAPFMPAFRGVVQRCVRGAWGRARGAIGCSAADAARSRCASVGTATAATSTALRGAPRFADASRCATPVIATSKATTGPVATRLGNGRGVPGRCRKWRIRVPGRRPARR